MPALRQRPAQGGHDAQLPAPPSPGIGMCGGKQERTPGGGERGGAEEEEEEEAARAAPVVVAADGSECAASLRGRKER